MSRLLVAATMLAAPADVARAIRPSIVPGLVAQARQAMADGWTKRKALNLDTVEGQQRFPEGPVWQPALTPPFPVAWPPDGNGRMVFYAYATGFTESLKDAVHVSGAWGRMTVTLGKLGPLTDLGPLRDVGIVGFGPINDAERIGEQQGEAQEALFQLARSRALAPPADVLRRYYCDWSARNSAVADDLRPKHPGFFAWLGCK